MADGAAFAVAGDWMPGRSHAIFNVEGTAMGVKIDLVGTGDPLALARHGLAGPCAQPARRRACPADAEEAAARYLEDAALPDAGRRHCACRCRGRTVEAGQSLATVEAMKMENILRAERRGVVKRIAVSAGASLAVDELIMEFE